MKKVMKIKELGKDGKEYAKTLVVLTGRLTKDPTLVTTKTDRQMVNGTSLAVNLGKDKTEFYTLKGFDKTAENFAKYATKGRLVLIVGTLQTETYKGKDGQDKTSEVVFIDNFELLDTKKVGGTDTKEEKVDTKKEEVVEVVSEEIPDDLGLEF